MTNKKIILDVKNLCKFFPVYSKGVFKKVESYVKACNNVSFKLYEGETLGLVGESGCGKTTTARAVLRAIEPTSGEVIYYQDDKKYDITKMSNAELKPMRQHMQMIFQDPFSSLNPRMTVGEIIGEPLIVQKLSKSKFSATHVAKIDSMLLRVGLKPEHKTRYPHAFSGGQRQRIGIARALITEPSFIVADEAVSALDVSVQAQVINLFAQLQKEFNLSTIFVAHDLSVVKHICDHVAVMYVGKIVELAPTKELFENPQHPYTKILLSSVPNADPDIKMVIPEFTEVADASNLPTGCAFAPRCPKATPACSDDNQFKSELKEITTDHWVSCRRKIEY